MDECKRREYDRQYSDKKSKSTTQPSNTSYSTPHTQPTTKNDEVDTSKERAGIAAILKAKAASAAQCSKTRKIYEDAIFELQREVRKLQVAIREIDDKEKQVEAEEAAKNSWTAWMLRPIYGAPIETEEEKESKSRETLGRMHSKDIKERELKRKEQEWKEQEWKEQEWKEQELKEWEEQFRAREREKEAADKKHDADRATLEAAIWLKNEMLKQQRERVERETKEKARRERIEKERTEREAAAKAWREELEKQRKETEAREKAWREQREKDKREAVAQQKARRESKRRKHNSGKEIKPKLF